MVNAATSGDVTDVVVIGAGIVGAAIAAELAARGCSVLVLEAEAVTDRHASGRSAAVWRLIPSEPEISAMIAASKPLLETPAEEMGGRSFLKPRPVLFVAAEGQEAELEALSASYRALQPILPTGLSTDLVAVEAAEARERCPGLARTEFSAATDPTAADIDVTGLHQAYVKRTRLGGGRVELGRAVVGVTPNRSGGWRVATTAAGVTAAIVVNAAGAWGDRVAALAGVAPVGLAPLRRTVATFNPGRFRRDEGPMVVDVGGTFYFKPDGATVLASPFDEHPDEPGDARPKEIDVAGLLDRLCAATRYFESGPPRIRSAWAGLRTFSPDRKPVFGADPAAEGFFWAVGLGGYGIETAPAYSTLCAELMLDSASEVPAAFAPHRFSG